MTKPALSTRLLQAIADVLYIWKQECRSVFRDAGVLVFVLLVPLAYPLLYSFIYTGEAVHEVPVLVVNDSHSALSREYLRKVDATADVRIVGYCSNLEEARRQLDRHAAYGIVYVPREFSHDLARGRQTFVSIFCDMSGLLYYKALLMANTAVSLDMNRDIKARRAGNTTLREDELTAYPIAYDEVALFNPTTGFAAFLIPAVLVLILQQTLLLGIGMGAGTQRETNRFCQLVPVDRRYGGTMRIVTGKALCYLPLYALVSFYVLGIVPKLFSLNQIGNACDIAVFILPYLLACIFFAMTCTLLVRNREACMLLFVFTSVPLLFISGISWPGSAVPPFWQSVSWIFPSTFGINGFVKLNNMGATLHETGSEWRALWMQCGVYFVTTCMVYRRQIYLSRINVIRSHRAARMRAAAKPEIASADAKK